MNIYMVRTEMFDMTAKQWADYRVVFGSQEVIKTNVPIFFETIGLVSSHSAVTNDIEKEFIKELYEYERSQRRYIMVRDATAHTPARFWSWTVCKYEELEELKKRGYSESKCYKYLTKNQLEYLNENNQRS